MNFFETYLSNTKSGILKLYKDTSRNEYTVDSSINQRSVLSREKSTAPLNENTLLTIDAYEFQLLYTHLMKMNNIDEIKIFTDNVYLIHWVNNWRHLWRKNNFENCSSEIIKLFISLDELLNTLTNFTITYTNYNVEQAGLLG
jgi:ribonuclease HI